MANIIKTPREFPALCREGLAHHREGRFHDALASYDRALELDPDSSVTLNSRGVTFIALERIEEALSDFQGAMRLDPTYLEAYLNAGAALYVAGLVESIREGVARAVTALDAGAAEDRLRTFVATSQRLGAAEAATP